MTDALLAPPRTDDVERCPKRMVFGPCGGVRPDSSCELDAALPCPWTDPDDPVALRTWHGPTRTPRVPAPGSLLDVARTRPVVMVDLSVPPYDRTTLRAVAATLAPVADTVLVGEHHDHPNYPPTVLAAELLEAGIRPWVTLTCRDRNRVVLEQELAGLVALGVEGVLCVTGDGRGPDVRPDASQVFDLDSTRLVALAREAGLTATVGVAPASPTADLRTRGLAEKQHAGAELAVMNHVSSAEALDAFLTDARAVGADLPVLGAAALYTDVPSARSLQAFPGLALDPDAVEAVLAAPDPVAAGIEAAVAEARALLAVPGVVGIDVSGSVSSAGWLAAAEIAAEVARRIGGERA